jgi:hypothetical protein
VTADVARLVRSVLGSPTSELVLRRQVIDLARANLHQAAVTAALLEALPLVGDTETRDALLGLLMSLDTSRLETVDALHDALIRGFHEERSRSTRAALIARLAGGLHQDPRLATFLVELLGEPSLGDEERAAVTAAVAALPTVDEATAMTALEQAQGSATAVQRAALAIAERCPSWTPAVVEALAPYLDVRSDRLVRLRILRGLVEARALDPTHLALLQQILRHDPDADARALALDLLRSIRPWTEELFAQLLWTGAHDADAGLRARAVGLQREVPQLSEAQVVALAGQLATDRGSGVRAAIVTALKPYLRAPQVRAGIAESFASNPSAFDDAEVGAIIDALAPYAGRDALVRTALLASVETLPVAAQRARLLEAVVPALPVDDVAGLLARLFERERDEGVRRSLFGLLEPLSVARHRELVRVFVAELVDPGSPFRDEVAPILAGAAELHPEIPPALEDVLLHDRDRTLVRACLDGYLRPKVPRSFEPLLSVVGNEGIDTVSRQRALDELASMDLGPGDGGRLDDALAGMKPDTLRVPGTRASDP